jgi:hypothetical protein
MSLQCYSEFLDALSKTLSPYLSGQGTLAQAIDDLVQALSPAAR